MFKSLRNTFIIFISLILLLPCNSNCQDSDSADSARAKLIAAAREIITSAKSCGLISLDKEGHPRIRPMDAFEPEKDLTVWFGTNSKSRKVDQIRNDPRVTLYYINAEETGYVTIHGTALLVDDPKEKEKRWKDEWDAFYPNREEAYLLIKVFPKWMEVISYSHDINGDPVTWQPATVVFDK